MRKFLSVLLVGVLLAGCQKPVENKTSNAGDSKKDIFTSVKDAVTKQMLLKCMYTDEDGEQVEAYIKGMVVRMIGKDDEGKIIGGLIKDGRFYLWGEEQKKGMIIPMESFKDAKMGSRPIKSVDDVIAVLEEKKDKCSLSPESAGLLDIPADVQFEDAKGFFE